MAEEAIRLFVSRLSFCYRLILSRSRFLTKWQFMGALCQRLLVTPRAQDRAKVLTVPAASGYALVPEAMLLTQSPS